MINYGPKKPKKEDSSSGSEIDMSWHQDTPDWSHGEFPDCPQCGEKMGYSYLQSTFKCPGCGYVMDEDDWHYKDDSEVPFGCEACGGPYPYCKDSCALFDVDD